MRHPNVLLIRYGQGWTERINAAGLAAVGRRESRLDLGAVQSEAEAFRIADEVLALAEAPDSIDLTLDPTGPDDDAVFAFDVHDRGITIATSQGPVEVECVELDFNLDDNGDVTVNPTFGRVILEADDRLFQMLKKSGSPGTFSGRTGVSQSPVGIGFDPPTRVPNTSGSWARIADTCEFCFQQGRGVLDALGQTYVLDPNGFARYNSGANTWDDGLALSGGVAIALKPGNIFAVLQPNGDVYEYDVGADSLSGVVTSAPDAPTARYTAGAAYGTIYRLHPGGTSYALDVGSYIWRTIASPPGASVGGIVVGSAGRAWFFDGPEAAAAFGNQILVSTATHAYVYDPGSNHWGTAPTPPSSAVFIFDPLTQTYAEIEDPTNGGQIYGAAPLRDGRVLIVSYCGDCDAWIWTPGA